ncbi:uncharacterized protein LOC102808438, partial [Saccoglossus kowalevskii]|uniref:Ras-interacting protein RIP3-like n=1 Tax=Saccoglossus kowalevskii TaxID=10224 RepID=A0ABM0LZV0_SACKO
MTEEHRRRLQMHQQNMQRQRERVSQNLYMHHVHRLRQAQRQQQQQQQQQVQQLAQQAQQVYQQTLPPGPVFVDEVVPPPIPPVPSNPVEIDHNEGDSAPVEGASRNCAGGNPGVHQHRHLHHHLHHYHHQP